MAMSISSESSNTSMCPNSLTPPCLLPLSPIPSTRTFGSPTPKKLIFSTTEHIEPIQLCPVKMEDLDDEDGSPLVLPTTDLAAQCPKEISIGVECFERVHNTQEAEAKLDPPIPDTNTTTNTNPSTEILTLNGNRHTVLHVAQQLEYLWCSLQHFNERNDPRINPEGWESPSSHSSGWSDNNDEELDHLWPKLPMMPPKGDDMHSPQMTVCGTHPGQGWEINNPLTKNYYRFLIPDSSTKCNIIAPFITYRFARCDAPSISGTYGSGYPIHTHPLTATPMDYVCPTITLDQLCLLDTKEPFANTVNHIINMYFPLNLSTTVRQYQHFRETEYAIQCTIHKLQEKEMCYIEKAVGVLQELENANILGHLLMHEDEIHNILLQESKGKFHPISSQDPLTSYTILAKSFRGTIMQSALDVCPNKWCHCYAQTSRIALALMLIKINT